MEGHPDESPVLQLVSALGAVHDRLEDALEPVGLSLAKFGVLARLAAAGRPLPLRTLAERCACVRSNITQLVDRLEAEALVVRAADPHDRRVTLAALTAEGRQRYEAGVNRLKAAEEGLFGSLPEVRRNELLQWLDGVRGSC